MDKSTQQHYLDAMGIQAWEMRDYATADADGGARDVAGEEGESAVVSRYIPEACAPQVDVVSMGWEALERGVKQCQMCELHSSRTQAVFGVGDRQAQLMIIGEAPGVDEDQQGEPFVGPAGQLLNDILFAIGFKRQQVYIANILKCRPPSNRDPHVAEVSSCEAWLYRQIQLIQPRLIIALGRVAAQNLLKTEAPLAQLRGHCHTFNTDTSQDSEIPVLVTYHPAYLLRSPREKRKVWEDLQSVSGLLEQ
jgi:DNA polymerase